MKARYKLRIKDLPVIERPREKLFRTGLRSLSELELVAIIIGSGTMGESALGVADRLLKKGDITSIDLDILRKAKGVGQAKAGRLLASIELGRRLFSESVEKIIGSCEDAFECTRDISANRKEHLLALYLDTRNALIKKETISIGTLNTNSVHPREVFHPAVSEFASGIILVHNHPSGDCEPSAGDIEFTKRMVKAGKLMGIEVLDHIIIGNGKYTSLNERGLI